MNINKRALTPSVVASMLFADANSGVNFGRDIIMAVLDGAPLPEESRNTLNHILVHEEDGTADMLRDIFGDEPIPAAAPDVSEAKDAFGLTQAYGKKAGDAIQQMIKDLLGPGFDVEVLEVKAGHGDPTRPEGKSPFDRSIFGKPDVILPKARVVFPYLPGDRQPGPFGSRLSDDDMMSIIFGGKRPAPHRDTHTDDARAAAHVEGATDPYPESPTDEAERRLFGDGSYTEQVQRPKDLGGMTQAENDLLRSTLLAQNIMGLQTLQALFDDTDFDDLVEDMIENLTEKRDALLKE